ncbi:hypothetical protein IFM89_012845 [Coptis chinensis]|uniref:J domain-containing protein n=1 Tax=Coptis chinensis TaxID=261450 RepID=A0A835M9L5_9MAGN|nr:hypothetical protein IFM89_012845 [Coptis chinensis]
METKVEHHKDYYKVLEVDYDVTDEKIRLNFRKLALKWHPDKHNGDHTVTTKFQEINEAYRVLSDPAKRLDYDLNGNYEINRYTLGEYLTRFKGMILTCNGLGISQASICDCTPKALTVDLVTWFPLLRAEEKANKKVETYEKVFCGCSSRQEIWRAYVICKAEMSLELKDKPSVAPTLAPEAFKCEHHMAY